VTFTESEGLLAVEAIVLKVSIVVGLRDYLFKIGQQNSFFLVIGTCLILDAL
jgi:hypothetical protein